MSELDIRSAKSKLEDQLLGIDGINGIGIGLKSNKHILKVLIDESVCINALPKSIDGFDVEYNVTGPIRAY